MEIRNSRGRLRKVVRLIPKNRVLKLAIFWGKVDAIRYKI